MPSFFKKPAWANTTNSSSSKGDFYRRSDQIYADVIALEREKAAKKHETTPKPEEPQPPTPREPKRRRISHSEEGDAEKTDPPPSSPTSYKTQKPEKSQPPREQPAPTSPGSSRKRSNGSPVKHRAAPSTSPSTRNVIDVEADLPKRTPRPSPNKNGQQGVVNISDGEDNDDSLIEEEEFPELARKARERAKRATTQPESRDSPLAQAASAGEQHGAVSLPQATQSTEDADSRVEILVTSDLENTNPLFIRRKLAQNLKDVRVYWCRRQGFSPEMTASVFLTWKGKRLFDVTTCKSLGINRSHSDEDLFDTKPEGDLIRVHMEAVTEELFQAQKAQRTASFTGGQGEESADSDEDNPGQIYRVTLKAPDIEDLPMKVLPTTPIANVIKALVDARGISSNKSVYLLFDGERLDPSSAIADSDIADLDCIDVLIR